MDKNTSDQNLSDFKRNLWCYSLIYHEINALNRLNMPTLNIKQKFLVIFFIFLISGCNEPVALIQQNDCASYKAISFMNYDSLKSDPIALVNASVDGDCLKLTLQYGGGCEEHQVDLALILPECGTPPLPPPTFEIRHDAKGDACKALITKEYSFDLSGIREDGKSKTEFILITKDSSGIPSGKTYTYTY